MSDVDYDRDWRGRAERAEREVRRLKALLGGVLIVMVNGELTLEGQHMIAADLKKALAEPAQVKGSSSEEPGR